MGNSLHGAGRAARLSDRRPPAAEVEPVTPTPTPTLGASDSLEAAIATPELTATQPWKIIFAVKDRLDPATGRIVDPNWERAWQGAQVAAADFGIEVVLLPNDCQTCVEEQIRAIGALIAQGEADGLAIGAVDSLALVPVVEKAIAAGIPVVAIDTPLNSDRLVTTVGFDNFTAGQVMGEWVAGQLPADSSVAILNGPPDHQNAVERREG
ncbi:MAG: sugar ABC transporter substrate-binding protein, partial [Spirulinaceae cyanobacterium RM2_2_10]|nr:sugar ABC transporter substrate-binding protein [Spirulinaceae cyanobacterium RM2_2_10]